MWPLRFNTPLLAPPSARLRFGATGSVAPPVSPRLSMALRTQLPWAAPRAALAAAQVPWQAGGAARVAAGLSWVAAAQAGTAVRLPWHGRQALGSVVVLQWAAPQAAALVARLPWLGAVGISTSTGLNWQAALAQALQVIAPWERALQVAQGLGLPWQASQPAERSWVLAWQAGGHYGLANGLPWGPGERLTGIGSPWVPVGPPLPPPVDPCYHPSPRLRFLDALPHLARLLFACRRAALIRVAQKEVYVISDTSSLVRIDTGDSIPVIGMSISLDRDSWTLAFSASLPASALDLIQPNVGGDPVQLLATVNGVGFRAVVESMGRDRVFRDVGVRVQGRGRACALDAPAWPQSSFTNAGAVTSQQLLDAALPTGWSAAWGLEAWLVPAGIWLHQGTPISAALAIAAAGGGYLQTHRTDAVLQVMPQYPLPPWEWLAATPDIELPAEVMERETIEWVTRPGYNGVYVSGVRDGVLRLVKRTGTAGDLIAPMVTDALITREAAARQRGLPLLCDTGRQAQVGLQLPVLAETGVILPGKLVRYVDGGITRVGLTRGVRVDVAYGKVTQTIRVETHV